MRLSLSLLEILKRTCLSVELDAEASPFNRLHKGRALSSRCCREEGQGLFLAPDQKLGCGESDKGRLDQHRGPLAFSPIALRHCQSLGMLKANKPTDRTIRK